MKVTISEERKNPLMNRTEYIGEIHFEAATPPRYEMKLAIAKHLKVNPELVIVKKVRNVFGEKRVLFKAHVYKSLKELEKVSKVLIRKNKKPEAGEKAEEKPAPAEEKPSEEKQGEVKEAEKKEGVAAEEPKEGASGEKEEQAEKPEGEEKPKEEAKPEPTEEEKSQVEEQDKPKEAKQEEEKAE
ncbi:hypothetical protein DRJ48_04165 [Candidatus Woesearchaeota archaeon]|nr:MAG: hypothetical protein DRJ48_04165 [Candidatus Woesearchaeota archaeon]